MTRKVKNEGLRRLVRRLKADAMKEEAEAVKIVDMLMREYGFTRDPLSKVAQQLSGDLRKLVAEWIGS